ASPFWRKLTPPPEPASGEEHPAAQMTSEQEHCGGTAHEIPAFRPSRGDAASHGQCRICPIAEYRKAKSGAGGGRPRIARLPASDDRGAERFLREGGPQRQYQRLS